MSKTTEIKEALNVLVETNLTGYVKLPDSYDSLDNPTIQLDKGFSVAYGTATNADDEFCKGTIRISRTFDIFLSNVYLANLNTNRREDLEDSLMNDATTLIGQIQCNQTLFGASINAEYSSDTGIEYLTNDRKQFITIILTVSVDYQEVI